MDYCAQVKAAYALRWENPRIVSTGILKTTDNRYILGSVFGQLSDGIWENNESLRDFGTYARTHKSEDEIEDSFLSIEISTKGFNPYKGMTDKDVFAFIADKIKKIVDTEKRHNIEAKEKYAWKKDNDFYSEYLDAPISAAVELRKKLLELSK